MFINKESVALSKQEECPMCETIVLAKNVLW